MRHPDFLISYQLPYVKLALLGFNLYIWQSVTISTPTSQSHTDVYAYMFLLIPNKQQQKKPLHNEGKRYKCDQNTK